MHILHWLMMINDKKCKISKQLYYFLTLMFPISEIASSMNFLTECHISWGNPFHLLLRLQKINKIVKSCKINETDLSLSLPPSESSKKCFCWEQNVQWKMQVVWSQARRCSIVPKLTTQLKLQVVCCQRKLARKEKGFR